jgi:hypothetical protein
MSSYRRSPRAIDQRDYVPSSPGSNSSGEADGRAGGAGPWTPTMAHRPDLTFNPLVPESQHLPGGGVLQWSPGVPRDPERDHAHKFDDLHGSTPPPRPPPNRPTVHRAPPSERQSTDQLLWVCATRTLQLLLLLGAGVMILTSVNPTWADGVNPFTTTDVAPAAQPPPSPPPPPAAVEPLAQLTMYMEVVGADSCEAAGCSSIESPEACAAAATDVYCNVGVWYCSSGVCEGDPVAVSRSPSSTTYVPYCSISTQLVQRVGLSPAPAPTVNFRADPEVRDSRNPPPRCADATKCVCNCHQLIQVVTEPDQRWWCLPAGQERDEARPPAISAASSPGCERDWPSCNNPDVGSEPGDAASGSNPAVDPEPGEEASASTSTARSSGNGRRTAERMAQPAAATAIGLLAAVYLSA